MNETNILILKLTSGEELLTEVEERSGVYLCSKPLLILTDPDPSTGQMRMGFMEFMPFAKAEAGMAVPSNMAIMAIPSDALANMYREKFGKIILPSKGKIVV